MDNTARFNRAQLLATLALAALAACASSPDLAIVSPAPGATLGPAQDLDPATPGLQIAVDATTSAADGSDAVATAGAQPVHANASGGKIHFPSVTFADGATTLTLAVVDAAHDKTAVVSANYSVDTFVSGCQISTPTNHTTVSADPGDTGLDSLVVQATCRGLAAGVQVGLLENDDAAPSQLQTPGAGGVVSFTADLIPGNNLIMVVAAGVQYDAVEVTLTSSRCRAEIEPPSGSRFNLDGAGGAIADTDPSTPGTQASVSVKTNCADGTTASISIQSGGVVQVTSTGPVQGGAATFTVTLPEGVLDVQGFVGAPGAEGASRHAAWSNDGTEPAIQILSPVAGGVLGPQDDVGTGSQFVARVRGQIANLDSGGYAALELDQGTPDAMEIPVTPDLTTGIFTTDVVLSSGSHVLFAKVQRASGNIDTTAPIEFSVVTSGSALAIVSPGDGTQVGLSQLVAGNGGAQATFLLQSAGLAGSLATVNCGTGLMGSAQIASDGTASIPIMLPIASCAGALFRCSASANSGATVSPAITFTADNTAPVVTITAPANNATAGNTTELQATTSCSGEGQFYTLSNNGNVVASGTVQNNSIDLNVALVGGQNQLTLTVTDAASNSGTASVEVISSMNAFPNVAFVTPTSNAVYGPTAPQLDCSTPAKPLLKAATISISGDTVQASGLTLKLTNSTGTSTVQTAPAFANGDWTWSRIVLSPESNTLAVTASDAAGNQGTASVSFTARCTSLGVGLAFAASGNDFGYAQDTDHSTPGVQLGAQVTATAANGSSVRLCSTALSATPGGCATAGTGALTVTSGTPAIQSGIASFTVTLPEGPQTVYAEVTDVGTEASAGTAITVRATPPTVVSIAVAEDTQGQMLADGPDNALNQTELDSAAGGDLHFQVVFGANSFIVNHTVQLFSTASSTVLGSAIATQNGDGTTALTIPVPVASLNPGGYQSDVFYVLTTDDAGNTNSTPSTLVAGVAATTLGTQSAPFVIAPDPTISLTAPAPGTSELNASNDVRCAGGTCPDSDPLEYAFAATTSAPDASATGVTSEITFLEDGSAIAPGASETNPTATNDGAVTGVDLPIANGTGVILTAQVLDPYGNVVTSAATTTAVDSVPPSLTISTVEGNSAAGGAVTIDEPLVNAVISIPTSGGGALEMGQQVAIFSDGASVGSAQYDGSGSATIPIAIPFGAHTLIAKATDLAGNAGASPAVSAVQTYTGPTIALSQPAPVAGGTLYFGSSTQSGSGPTAICAPTLGFTTGNVQDGNTVDVWVVGASAACGTPPNGALTANVSSNSAILSSAPFNLTDGTTGKLCAQTNQDASTVQITPQAFQCDLQTPAVAWVSPSANQLFVGNGQSQLAGSATLSTSTDDTKLGLADAALTITAPTGGTLILSVQQNATTTTEFAKCAVAASSSQQTIYALSTPATPSAFSNCSTTLGSGGTLTLPVDYAQPLLHTLTASFTAPSGNSTNLTETVRIDVAEPAAPAPTTAAQSAIGVFQVSIPTLPGDDQTVGGNAQGGWDVRYSTAALTTSNWFSATQITANLAGNFPTTLVSSFQVVLPAGNQTLNLGVRAIDRVGNLGDIGETSVSTQPVGSSLALKDDSGAAPTSTFGQSMRVADLDGDGYDDIILAYSSTACDDGGCNGRILVYFGGPGGVINPNAPLVLTGLLADGYLGSAQGFDVGDFDGDGKADIAASEWEFGVGADVAIWKGTDLKAAKPAAGGSTPTVLQAKFSVSDSSVLVGATVRAVGQISGGASALAGDDLLITNYQIGDGAGSDPDTGADTPYTFEAAILQRQGSWLNETPPTPVTNLFSSGSPAVAFITLRLPGDSDPNSTTDSSTVDAAIFSYVATAGGDLEGLALSKVYIDPNNVANEHDLRLFGGDAIAAGGTLAWSSGTELPTVADVDSNSVFGAAIAGGKDAVGDGHLDLLVANNQDASELFLFDGAQLLGADLPPVTTPATLPAFIDYSNTPHNIGEGAYLLPDLDGDGKAEIAGATDPVSGSTLEYVWFGQSGDAATAPLPFFNVGNDCTSLSVAFCFTPDRGQQISTAPVFTGTPIGQAIGAGHVSALSGRDLVILSQNQNSDGSAPGTVVIIR